MGDYIDIESVRRTVGIGVSEISDDDVTAIITEIEPQISRYFNTKFIPTQKIEILDGDGTNRLLLNQNPLLSVRALKIDGTTEDPANLEIYKDSGYIWLGSSASTSTFKSGRNEVVIKYIYGTVEHSSTDTTISSATTAGTNVSLSVASITDFADEDWVEIYGMDGHREVAQIKASPSGSTIVVDQLVQTHESGSSIVKLQINENFKKLMNVCCSLAMVARFIGQSYTDIVGYDIGEMHVQKGEAYSQWAETARQLIKERDTLLSRISIRPCII